MAKELVTVVELAEFIRRAKSRLNDEERAECIEILARDPESGVVMQGTGGFRKLRFATEGRGKSGSVRIVYYYYNRSIPVLLVSVFAKNEKANLTKAERNVLAKLGRTLASYGE